MFRVILPRVSPLRGIIVGLWLAGAYAACSRVEVVDPLADAAIGGGGAGGEQHGGSGSLAGENASGEGGTSPTSGGAPAFVDVALWPTYSSNASNDGTQAVLAAVTALSAGSLTLPIHARWNELVGATGSPRAVAWQRLDALTKPYRDRDGKIALCIDIVDRTLEAWPFMGELDLQSGQEVMERTLDLVFARFGGQLSLVCFGYELDRYLELATEKQHAQLVAILKEAVRYATGHSLRGQAKVGVALTLGAVASASDVYDELSLGDEVVAVYDPLAGNELKAPDAVATELASALDTIARHDEQARPLALFEVGYPTSSTLESSEQQQVAYFDALMGALDGARDSVDFVGLFGLDDRAPAACDTEARLFGTPDDATPEEQALWVEKRAAARCSMGLRAETDDPDHVKAAWPRALAALSRYAP
jgi:hypothetical protein